MLAVTGLQLGSRSAFAVFVIGVMYVIVLAIQFVMHGVSAPITDPILAVMEVLTLVSASCLLVLMATVHEYAAPGRKIYSMIAFAFMALMVGVTSVVHFVELSAIRQLGVAEISWPSPIYGAELLAWNLFLGLSLLFASRAFDGDGSARLLRRGMTFTGGLCVVGIVGPLAGIMRLQLIGVFGYAILLPMVSLKLSRFFGDASNLNSLQPTEN